MGGSAPGVESSRGNAVAPDCGGDAGVFEGCDASGEAIAFDELVATCAPAVPCAIARSNRFAASAFVVTRRAMMSEADAGLATAFSRCGIALESSPR